MNQSGAPVKLFAYDAIGNLLSKSDVGNYAYPLAGSALPHAVTSISGGAVSTSFTYDPNGNQTSGLGRSISYTSYNKPSSITQGRHQPELRRLTGLLLDILAGTSNIIQNFSYIYDVLGNVLTRADAADSDDVAQASGMMPPTIPI